MLRRVPHYPGIGLSLLRLLWFLDGDYRKSVDKHVEVGVATFSLRDWRLFAISVGRVVHLRFQDLTDFLQRRDKISVSRVVLGVTLPQKPRSDVFPQFDRSFDGDITGLGTVRADLATKSASN